MRILRSVVLYPVTIVYLGAVLAVGFVVENVVRPELALVALGVVALLTLVVAVQQDLSAVHTLVNSQRDEMIAQIARLEMTLSANGLPVPETPAEAEVRRENGEE